MAATTAIASKVILEALPVLVEAAKSLWGYWSSKPKALPVDPSADVRTQVAAVSERLSALENTELEQARLIAQLAGQLEAVARRVVLSYWIAVCGLVIALIAALLALFR